MKENENVIGCCPHCAKDVYDNETYVKRGTSLYTAVFHENCYRKIMRDPDRRPSPFNKESKFA
jgi:hypothetical protein